MRIIRETGDEWARRVAPKVEVEFTTRERIVYKAPYSNHLVTLELSTKTKKGWGCTCVHGIHGFNKLDELCKHIKCVQHAIKARGGMTW